MASGFDAIFIREKIRIHIKLYETHIKSIVFAIEMRYNNKQLFSF